MRLLVLKSKIVKAADFFLDYILDGTFHLLRQVKRKPEHQGLFAAHKMFSLLILFDLFSKMNLKIKPIFYSRVDVLCLPQAWQPVRLKLLFGVLRGKCNTK